MYSGDAVNSIFESNFASNGGALYSVSAISCNFKNNEAELEGSDMYSCIEFNSKNLNNTYNTITETPKITLETLKTTYDSGEKALYEFTLANKKINGVPLTISLLSDREEKNFT